MYTKKFIKPIFFFYQFCLKVATQNFFTFWVNSTETLRYIFSQKYYLKFCDGLEYCNINFKKESLAEKWLWKEQDVSFHRKISCWSVLLQPFNFTQFNNLFWCDEWNEPHKPHEKVLLNYVVSEAIFWMENNRRDMFSEMVGIYVMFFEKL